LTTDNADALIFVPLPDSRFGPYPLPVFRHPWVT